MLACLIITSEPVKQKCITSFQEVLTRPTDHLSVARRRRIDHSWSSQDLPLQSYLWLQVFVYSRDGQWQCECLLQRSRLRPTQVLCVRWRLQTARQRDAGLSSQNQWRKLSSYEARVKFPFWSHWPKAARLTAKIRKLWTFQRQDSRGQHPRG